MLKIVKKIFWKTVAKNAAPCEEMLAIVKSFKASGKNINVAEIGVDSGATSEAVVRLLGPEDAYYMFDFKNVTGKLKDKLNKATSARIFEFGNSTRTYDSYNWSLANLWKGLEDKELFDVVYLDGAHTFAHDGLACCILKKMLKKGGVLLFDDLYWTIWTSPTVNPTVNPKTKRLYTDEQMKTRQVQLVVDMFMKTDRNFEEIEEYSSSERAAYRKIGYRLTDLPT